MNIKIKVMLLWFCLAAITVSAQNTYKGTNGKVSFFAEAPFGNIEAESSMVSSTFIDPSGQVAVTIPVKSFVFKKKLMQEHFNEKSWDIPFFLASTGLTRISALTTGE